MQLLKIEWLKIKNYRTFWILIGIFVSLGSWGMNPTLAIFLQLLILPVLLPWGIVTFAWEIHPLWSFISLIFFIYFLVLIGRLIDKYKNKHE